MSGVRRWLLRVGPYGSALLGGSMIALIWLGAMHFSASEREQARDAAIQNANNLSRTFEENIIRSIRAVDQTILYIRDSYARDPDHVDLPTWARDQQFLSGITFQIAIIGPTGLMVTSNIPGSTPGVDLSDREHVRVHLGDRPDTLFISKPVLGRVSNKWSIQLTRRIIMPNGSFGGVVVMSLDPAYLSDFYKSIDVGEHGAITLVGADGIVRARGARGESAVGDSLADSPLFKAFAKSPAGHYETRSRLDHVDRLFVYRKIRDFPLLVVVGLARSEIFGAFEESRARNYQIAGLLSLWLVVVTSLVGVYQRALARALRAAEAGTRARSDFLAMMSHEIRTPMNGVIGMAECLVESGLDPRQLEMARTMRVSASHLLGILNDVLDFSKLDAGQVELESIAFDPRETARTTVALLEPSAREKGLVLALDIAADAPALLVGDPARARQILFNLLGNAIKFTREGRVELSLRRGDRDGAIVFKVSDTGIGIPADGLPLLFRQFSQLDSSIARRFGGTGLGLAITKRLVDVMRGEINVESIVGVGTSFTVTLRLEAAAGEDAPVPADAPVAHAPAPRWRILLAEDDATNRIVATNLLRQLGHDCDVVENGAAAVEACRQNVYDIVFMDVMMPGMDGLAATRAIRALPAPHRDARVIALTANAGSGDRAMCLNAGMDDFLAKPVTRAELRAALARAADVAPSSRAVAATQARDDEAIAAFNAATFDTLAEALGDDALGEVVAAFARTGVERLAAMTNALRDEDREKTRREAHALKGSSATLGFDALSAACRALETASPEADAGELARLLATVETEFEAASRALETRARPRAIAA